MMRASPVRREAPHLLQFHSGGHQRSARDAALRSQTWAFADLRNATLVSNDLPT